MKLRYIVASAATALSVALAGLTMAGPAHAAPGSTVNWTDRSFLEVRDNGTAWGETVLWSWNTATSYFDPISLGNNSYGITAVAALAPNTWVAVDNGGCVHTYDQSLAADSVQANDPCNAVKAVGLDQYNFLVTTKEGALMQWYYAGAGRWLHGDPITGTSGWGDARELASVDSGHFISISASEPYQLRYWTLAPTAAEMSARMMVIGQGWDTGTSSHIAGLGGYGSFVEVKGPNPVNGRVPYSLSRWYFDLTTGDISESPVAGTSGWQNARAIG
ncbi:MAG: hypothetical protein HOW97_03550 [Catenulispora sp.]|nr:hypothetical protein [Catenulispora sp.]NUR60997.1 hypothetical protein [Catenulispora sp.]